MLLPVLALLVALGACGGGGDEAATTTTTTTGSTATSTTAEPTTTDGGAASTTASLPAVAGPFAEGRTPIPGFGEVEVRIVDGPDGEPIVLCVLHAETAAQRARGLMDVTDPTLGGYDGMVFTYAQDNEGSYWMKDTPLPLSLAYVAGDGTVITTHDMDPCPEGVEPCPSYPPDGPYRAVLEVPLGGFPALGLTAGGPARVELGGACAPSG